MRFSLIPAALLVSCTDVDRATPTIQTLASLDGKAAAPLTICDSLLDTSLALRFRVVGSGFVSEVRGATSDIPNVIPPTVQLNGPQGTSFVPTQIVRSAERIDVVLPGAFGSSAVHFVDGAYSVTVVDPDATTAGLANALVFQPPPVITSVSPATICADAAATVVLRGGPFSPGVTAAGVNGRSPPPSLPVRFDAPDQITVTIPAGTAVAGSAGIQIFVNDPDGCGADTGVGQACP
jgi:hypothetical protein